MAEDSFPPLPLREADLNRLLSLLAETAALQDSLAAKRNFTLSGLSELLGAQNHFYLTTDSTCEPLQTRATSPALQDNFFAQATFHELPDGVFRESLHGHSLLIALRTLDLKVISHERRILIFERPPEQPIFGTREFRILSILLEEMPSLYDDSLRESLPSPPPHSLSPRENQVLDLLFKGNSSEHIAQTLNISVHTAADYKKSLFKKLGVNSHSQLLSYALHATPFPTHS